MKWPAWKKPQSSKLTKYDINNETEDIIIK